MTGNPQAKSPFSADSIRHLYHWDQIEGYRLLREHLELHEGFSLIVVLAPDEWGLALLREQLPVLLSTESAITRVTFEPQQPAHALTSNLLDCAPLPDAVRLVWMDADPGPPEQADDRETAWRAALATLNRHRNTLPEKFQCTLALAMPSRLQKALSESAPDIWAIRSGVFRMEPAGGSRSLLEQLPSSERERFDGIEKTSGGDPLQTLAEADKLRDKPGREILLARLLRRAGNQFREQFKWADAERYLTEAYELIERYGRGDPELVWQMTLDMATVFCDTAQFARAEQYLRNAVRLAEQHLDDKWKAVALNDLAILLQDTNRSVEAEPLMRRALAIDEQFHGDEDPVVAIRLNNLAQVLKATNRLTEAEPMMRRALAIEEQSFGEDHPNLATPLNNLAMLLLATNRPTEAEPLIWRALAIDERAYGEQHANVARDLNNLATFLQSTNRLAEAELMMRRALAINEQSYGDDHPKIAINLNNLAQLLQDTNRLAEAEPLMRRALAINVRSYGEDHPQVATNLNNLAQLLHDTNRLAEAEPMYRRALAIEEQSYGEEHPNVAIHLDNLALLLHDTNRLDEAEPLMRRAVAIYTSFRKDTGHAHPHANTFLTNYERLLQEMNLPEDEIAQRLAEFQ